MTKKKKKLTRITAIVLTFVMSVSTAAVSMISPSAALKYVIRQPENYSSTVKLGAGENYQIIVDNYTPRPIEFEPCYADGGCVDVISTRHINNDTYYGQIKADTKLFENGCYGGVYVKVKQQKKSDVTYQTFIQFQAFNAPKSISLSKTSLTMGKNKTYTIKEATNSGSYANAKNLVWTSSNTSVVKVSKVEGTNKCTLRSTGKTGTATITVKTYNGKTATCKVTVK